MKAKTKSKRYVSVAEYYRRYGLRFRRSRMKGWGSGGLRAWLAER